MEVHVREKCKKCDGAGLIENPIWTEFHKFDEAFKVKTGDTCSIRQCREWFENAGRYVLPDEEISCKDCDGTGMVESWMPLKDLEEVLWEGVR